MISRRTALVGATAGLAVVGAGAAVWWSGQDPARALLLDPKLPDDARRDALAAHLRAWFHDLDLPEATLTAFVAAHRDAGERLPKDAGDLAELHKQFLMCTDFFLHDGDRAVPVRFVAWFDPYVTPCWNPLARKA